MYTKSTKYKMFNGIIRNQAEFSEFNTENNILKLDFLDFNQDQINQISLGDSIACNGTCLTVTKIKDRTLSFNLALETILKTNLTTLHQKNLINVEFPMRIGDKIDGHLSYGHIYGYGKIIEIMQDNIIRFETDNAVFQYLDYKAPITINGIALTISNIYAPENQFEVNIIPFTWENTNLKFAKINDVVNIEPDILAVYAIGITKRHHGK